MDITLFLALMTGALAGAGHVLLGPDHLAAVLPFSVNDRAHPWRSGLWWGVGHTGGVWIIGILAVVLKELLPLEALSHWSESLVGVVLIGMGIWGIRRGLRSRLHCHVHAHDGTTHAHFHLHQGERAHPPRAAATGHQHVHGPLGIGTLHGVAGSSHLFGVLPALALPGTAATAAYVVAFGLASIGTMTVFSWLLGRVVGHFSERNENVYPWTLGGAGAVAVLVGIAWLILQA